MAAAAAELDVLFRIVLGALLPFGVGEGASSSSLDSANRLRNAGRASSSSLESANRLLFRPFLAFLAFLVLFEERPKPDMRRLELLRSLESPRKDWRMRPPIATGGEIVPELRRKADPVGERERRLNRLLPLPRSDGGPADSRGLPLIVLLKPKPSPPPVRARRKLLSLESEPRRRRVGFVEALAVMAADGVALSADWFRLWGWTCSAAIG